MVSVISAKPLKRALYIFEQEQKERVWRFLDVTRFFYILFCIVLLSLFTNLVLAAALCAASVLAYGLLRLVRSVAGPIYRHIRWMTDYLDYVLLGAFIYFTGGIGSFFYPVYAVPIIGATVRSGMLGGVAGVSIVVITTVIMLLVPGNIHSTSAYLHLPHLITIFGTMIFIVYVVEWLARKERSFRARIYQLTLEDNLTGLYHSGYLRERVLEEIKRCSREECSCSIIFFDLDNFKQVNDHYGHIAGDKVLKRLAGFLLDNTRASEVLARYGGDEFVLLLPGADRAETKKTVERLQKRMQSFSCLINKQEICLKISVGIAVFPEDGSNFDSLIAVADREMYTRKSKPEESNHCQ